MTKIQNFKRFGHWLLEFGIYLLFGYCNLVLWNLGLGFSEIVDSNLVSAWDTRLDEDLGQPLFSETHGNFDRHQTEHKGRAK